MSGPGGKDYLHFPAAEGSNNPSRRIGHHPRFSNEDSPEVPTSQSDRITYVGEQIEYWIRLKLRDEWLWEEFRIDFGKWSQTDIHDLPKNVKGELRAFLRSKGVYVPRGRLTVPQGLVMVLEEEQPSTWPDAELTTAMEAEGFSSSLKDKKEKRDQEE